MTLRVIAGTCDCGKPALGRCGVGVLGLTLILCELPSCQPEGRWCAVHRHREGTMGYPTNARVRATFDRFTVVTGSLWEHIKVLCLNWFLSTPAKARYVWRHFLHSQMPPPAPLPKFTIQIGARSFESVGDDVVERDRGLVAAEAEASAKAYAEDQAEFEAMEDEDEDEELESP